MAAFPIVTFAVIASGVRAGYVYPTPSVPFELPNANGFNGQAAADVALNQLHRVAVSYSVPFEDFEYLKRIKNGQPSPHDFGPLVGNVPAPFSLRHVGGTSVLGKLVPQPDGVLANVGVGQAFRQVSIVNQNYDDAAAVRNEIKLLPVGNNGIVSANRAPAANQFVAPHDNQALVQNIINTQQYAQAPIVPRVSKHFYFHVPPPDLDEALLQRAPEPPKKSYKIIFVKVPSQEPSNSERIRQAVQANQDRNANEDKTLIYVLAREPETVQPAPQPPRGPSEHEVLFVKYKENQASAPPVPNELTQGKFLFNPSSILQRGSLNVGS